MPKITMHRIVSFLILSICCISPMLSVNAQTTDDSHLFPYPVVPEEKSVLSERCNFLVDHFWDRCNVKQAFSSLSRFEDAFTDWLAVMPFASADTVHMSIDRLIKNVSKTGAKNLLSLGKIAQRNLYADSAEYRSEELYLPFAKAVASNKKISNADKASFAAHAKLLANSKVGDIAPDFVFTQTDGSNANFNDIRASRIILFFNDPDCIDCALSKAQLAANYHLGKLIDSGLIKVVAIYPGEADDEWLHNAKQMPENWIPGASPDIDLIYTIPTTPTIYYLDAKHKILAKDVAVEGLLLNAEQLYNIYIKQPNQEQ